MALTENVALIKQVIMRILIFIFALLLLSCCGENQVVGPEFKTAKDAYGKYCDKDCYFSISIGAVGDFEKYNGDPNLQKRDAIYNFSQSDDWDGSVYIDKGSGVTGIGFWKLNAVGLIEQKGDCPGDTQGMEFNGCEIDISWMKTINGYEIYPDGIYYIRNSKSGIDQNFITDSEDDFKTFIRVHSCGAVFMKQ